MSNIKIIGHRGYMSCYPENSLLGFEKAIEVGADGLELDVQLTKDGELVVFHDERIDRRTNGQGAMKELTLDQLQTFFLLDVKGKKQTTEKIPTLKQFFETINNYPPLLINIELKTSTVLYEGIEEKVLQKVAYLGTPHSIVYSSFHLPTLVRLKHIDAEAKVALLTRQKLPNIQDYVRTFDLEGIHPRYNVYKTYKSSFKNITSLRVWTVNNRRQLRHFLTEEVSAIITDRPKLAIQLREKIARSNRRKLFFFF